jgi:hypothetical protein
VRLGPVVVTDTRWLWLLVPAVLLVALDLARGWGSRGQRVRGALVRLLVLATLAVALTDPRWERRRPSAHVIFVVDRSASMSEAGVAAALARAKELAATLGPDVRTGLVLSDGSPSVAVMPGQPWSVSEVPRGDKVESTDLGAALDLARALVPAGDSGQIVLLSDGRPTAGERRTTALAPRLGGLPVHTIAIQPERTDAAVTAVSLDDSNVRPGATTGGSVELDGGAAPFRGELLVRVDGELVHAQEGRARGRRVEEGPLHGVDPAGYTRGRAAGGGRARARGGERSRRRRLCAARRGRQAARAVADGRAEGRRAARDRAARGGDADRRAHAGRQGLPQADRQGDRPRHHRERARRQRVEPARHERGAVDLDREMGRRRRRLDRHGRPARLRSRWLSGLAHRARAADPARSGRPADRAGRDDRRGARPVGQHGRARLRR